MRLVEIGSRAEVGSSSSSTSGFSATARAMHSRCCWPPDRPSALWPSLSLTSSHSAAWRNACSTRTFISRSEEHTSELQSLMRNSYAVFCLKKKKQKKHTHIQNSEQERIQLMTKA